MTFLPSSVAPPVRPVAGPILASFAGRASPVYGASCRDFLHWHLSRNQAEILGFQAKAEEGP
jgi:hypothetical protein